jgi:hypothetical protein
MLKSTYLVLLFLFLAAPVFAADSSPTEESVKHLLSITDSRKMADDMMGQMDEAMKNAMKQLPQGQAVTPEQQKILDTMQSKMDALLKQELNWQSLEPLYIQIYRESFTQEEINGMLAFYETPVGQALIKKMPTVMQKSMTEMQKRMATLIPKFQKIQQDALSELKSQAKK